MRGSGWCGAMPFRGGRRREMSPRGAGGDAVVMEDGGREVRRVLLGRGGGRKVTMSKWWIFRRGEKYGGGLEVRLENKAAVTGRVRERQFCCRKVFRVFVGFVSVTLVFFLNSG